MNEQSMTVAIRTDYIELYKLLKLADAAASGGEAKYMISQGMVSVNGEPESRKRRKIVARDTVQYDGGRVTVVSAKEGG
ncbi:MAG: RNA-binding S4 domain-containing protein [Candidatus Electrothrix sp. EH2]|nr:RNA-binding S4 domain-containing protein [Candidatus Electrothrix sp. EH2]